MTPREVRQVVAWQRPVQWITCVLLWSVMVVATVVPDLDLPLRAIAAVGFAAALLRTAALIAEERALAASRWWRGLWLCADVALLTGLLDITGGPFNPFVVVYGVCVWVAVLTVSRAWGLAAGIFALAAYGWLLIDHLQPGAAEHHRLNDFPTHLFAMVFAGGWIGELVAYYVAQLEAARQRALRSERLASLTTLAASAAHELSTPLSTIAVAARELERTASHQHGPIVEDVRLIQGAVQRCRAILDGMSGRAAGDGARSPMRPAEIARLASAALPPERRERLEIDVTAESTHVIAAGVDVARALASLLKNAFDANPHDAVTLRAYAYDASVRFQVHDRGPGMTSEARQRAGEPFFTTKPPGEGMGLGLFLARTVAEQLGGSLHFEEDAGTVAILEIPAAMERVS